MKHSVDKKNVEIQSLLAKMTTMKEELRKAIFILRNRVSVNASEIKPIISAF